jgi:hypothetical protein
MIARTLSIAAAAACLAGALAPAAHAAKPDTGGLSVCNEAENSWRGGYQVTGDPVDPNPPARLLGSQMRVGNGHGAGLVNAAEHSPALRLCGPEGDTGDGGGTGDGGDGGGGLPPS